MEEGAERDGSLKDLGRGFRRSAYRRESPCWTRDGRGPATSTGRRGSTHVERDSARVPRRCVPPDREGARHRPGPTIARMGDGDRADRLSRQWTHVPSFSPLSTRTGFPSTERVTWASPPSPRKTTVPSGPT